MYSGTAVRKKATLKRIREASLAIFKISEAQLIISCAEVPGREGGKN